MIYLNDIQETHLNDILESELDNLNYDLVSSHVSTVRNSNTLVGQASAGLAF